MNKEGAILQRSQMAVEASTGTELSVMTHTVIIYDHLKQLIMRLE